MKRFIETFKLSLTSKAFYQRVVTGTEPMGFKYFFWLNALYSLIIACTFIPIVSAITSPQAHEALLSVIPADLTVTLSKGATSINQPEPYIIRNTSAETLQKNHDEKCKDVISQKCSSDFKVPKNAVVFDTKTPFTIEQFNTYDTTVLIKADSIIGKKPNGTIEVIGNPKDLDLTLNRFWLGDKISKYAWIANLIPVVIFIGFSTVGYAFTLLAYIIWALIVWLLLKIGKVAVGFKQAYSITLYTSIVFLALELISLALPFANNNLVQFVALAGFLYLMFKKDIVGSSIPDDDKNNGTV
jgi:Protein of unknown function (DUF1189)